MNQPDNLHQQPTVYMLDTKLKWVTVSLSYHHVDDGKGVKIKKRLLIFIYFYLGNVHIT